MLEKLQGNTLIITHRNADFDAITSSLLIKHYLDKYAKCETRFAIPEGPDRPVKQFLQRLGIGIDYVEDFSKISEIEFNNLILTDVSSTIQILDFSKLIEKCDNVILIDHHVVHDKTLLQNKIVKFVNTDVTSCTEFILYELGFEFINELPDWLTTLSIAAILTDSKKLSKANSITFQILSKLVEKSRIKYEDIVNSIFVKVLPFDEKMARIKGILRLKAYRFSNDKVFCISHVSAHEASLARTLLEVGCDIVAIVSEHDDEFRIILRCKEIENISLAEFAKEFASKFNGFGGGHRTSAALSIKKQEELKLTLKKLINICIREMERYLNTKFKRVKPN